MSAKNTSVTVDGVGGLFKCIKRQESEEMDLTESEGINVTVKSANEKIQDNGERIYKLSPGKFRGNVLIGNSLRNSSFMCIF